MPEIKINKSDEFFIALAKRDVHSFMFVGVKTSEAVYSLFFLGKILLPVPENYSLFKFIIINELRSIFYFSEASFYQESPRDREINYVAYAISYEQFLKFLMLAELIQQNNSNCLRGYKPKKQAKTEQGAIEFEYTKENYFEQQTSSEDIEKIIARSKRLNLFNTCRHSAIDLFDYVHGEAKFSAHISTCFLNNFPCETYLNKTRNPVNEFSFYILPLPPTAFTEQSEAKRLTLCKLFRRLEEMLKIEANLPTTAAKFNLLKQYYTQIAGDNMLEPEQLLTSIQTWYEENKKLITYHRKLYFFDHFIIRQTATEKMVNQLVTQLKDKSYELN